jgi:hypothetical protein
MRFGEPTLRNGRSAEHATATATDTDAHRLKIAAITDSPADPTFGAEAINADSARFQSRVLAGKKAGVGPSRHRRGLRGANPL